MELKIVLFLTCIYLLVQCQCHSKTVSMYVTIHKTWLVIDVDMIGNKLEFATRLAIELFIAFPIFYFRVFLLSTNRMKKPQCGRVQLPVYGCLTRPRVVAIAKPFNGS